jgi:anti-sigma regulatory factor (Ser/Thr protein kinase)
VNAPWDALERVAPFDDSVDDAALHPATLQVCRYVARTRALRSVIGDFDIGVPADDLRRHAVEAMRRKEFMAYTVSLPDRFDTDELCFVPQDGWCDILSIRTNGWHRHHGDHRRGLNEILSDLAAAVACAKLRILSAEELEAERGRGVQLVDLGLVDAAALASARRTIGGALEEVGLPKAERTAFVLCISEAASNMLLHGGGAGTLALRKLDDRLRAVVADRGPGLNFINWMEPPSSGGQASMGYGLKIILDNLDTVGLHTGESGTILLLDHMTT